MAFQLAFRREGVNPYHDPLRKGGSVQTVTGEVVYPLDPRLEEIHIEDIAHGLSHKARFSGHTRTFYSTAEHSVRVSWYLRDTGASVMEQYVGLHHDDTDYILPDVPTPLKKLRQFAWFRKVEHHFQALCFERFGCVYEDYSIIKNADIVLLLTEKRDLMPYVNDVWNTKKYTQSPIPEPYRIDPWTSVQAKLIYLQEHERLAKELGLHDVVSI